MGVFLQTHSAVRIAQKVGPAETTRKASILYTQASWSLGLCRKPRGRVYHGPPPGPSIVGTWMYMEGGGQGGQQQITGRQLKGASAAELQIMLAIHTQGCQPSNISNLNFYLKSVRFKQYWQGPASVD